MANTQEFLTIIKLNDSEAVNNLERLRKKVNDLTAARDKAVSSNSDSNFVKDLTKDLKKAKSELKSYDTNVRKTIETLDSLSTSSLEDIKKAMRAIKREQDKTTNPEDYKRLESLIDKCKERIDAFKNGMRGASAETENLAKVMQNVNAASLNQLNQAKTYLEGEIGGMSPESTSYTTTLSQLQEVKARIQQINSEQNKLVTTIDKYDNEIDAAKSDMQNVRRETKLVSETLGNISGASIRDLEYSLKIVEDRLRGMKRGTEEFQSMTAQAKRLRTELSSIRNEGSAQQSWMGKMADGFNKWQAAAMTAVATLTGLSLTVRKCVDDYAKMEDVLASTRKYTGLSDQSVRDLNEDFKKMDTRTSREQLNNFAGAAGRLGITSKEAIEDFVDGADKVSVALGDDLGDGAVDTIGKLAMAFGEDKKMGLRGAMLATGSALNEIAQNSSANAGYVVDFTARLAGMGMQAKLSQQDIMGYASVLDQNMQEAETSATALGQLITKIYQDPAKFAKLAGKNVKDFTHLLKTDANAAFMQFFKSMQSKGGFTQLAPMFDKMGLSGNRCVGVLSTMATKLDDVKTAQDLANKAYSSGTSVLNEFNIMNETENAKLDKAKKKFSELSIELGQKLLPIARYGITTGSFFVHVLSSLINFVSKYKVTLSTLAIAIGILTIAEMKDVAAKKLQALWNNYLVAGCKKLWAVLASHPYIAIAAAVASLVAIMIDLSNKTDAVTEAQKKLNDIKKEAAEQAVDEQQKIKTLVSVARDEHQSLKNRITATNELNRIIPHYNAQLDKTTGKYKENKKALDDYLNSLVRKYEIEGAKEKLAELGKQKVDAVIKLNESEKSLKSAKASGSGSGYTYTTSWGSTGNTTQDLVYELQRNVDNERNVVKDIVKQENIILGSYGDAIKKGSSDKSCDKVCLM
jgi:TP901 family phage tail tape measure protein